MDYYDAANTHLGPVTPLTCNVEAEGKDNYLLSVQEDLIVYSMSKSYDDFVELRKALQSRAPHLPQMPGQRLSKAHKRERAVIDLLADLTTISREGLPGKSSVDAFLSIAGHELHGVGRTSLCRHRRANELAGRSAAEFLRSGMDVARDATDMQNVVVSAETSTRMASDDPRCTWAAQLEWTRSLSDARDQLSAREQTEASAHQELSRLWQQHAWCQDDIDTNGDQYGDEKDAEFLAQLVDTHKDDLGDETLAAFQTRLATHQAKQDEANAEVEMKEGQSLDGVW